MEYFGVCFHLLKKFWVLIFLHFSECLGAGVSLSDVVLVGLCAFVGKVMFLGKMFPPDRSLGKVDEPRMFLLLIFHLLPFRYKLLFLLVRFP